MEDTAPSQPRSLEHRNKDLRQNQPDDPQIQDVRSGEPGMQSSNSLSNCNLEEVGILPEADTFSPRIESVMSAWHAHDQSLNFNEDSPVPNGINPTITDGKTTYQCKFCQTLFSAREKMKYTVHMKRKTCQHCRKSIGCLKSVRMHQKTKQCVKNKNFNALATVEKFQLKEAPIGNDNEVNDPGNAIVKTINSNFQSLITQEKSEKSSEPFTCKFCNLTIKSDHNREKHQAERICPKCESVFECSVLAKRHFMVKGSGHRTVLPKKKCAACGNLYRSAKFHLKNIYNIRCKLCKEVFACRTLCQAHRALCNMESRKKNNAEDQVEIQEEQRLPDESTQSDQETVMEVEEEPNSPQPKPKNCECCEFSSFSEEEFENHVRSELCPRCGEMQKCNSLFIKHVDVCHPLKISFQCPMCFENFSNAASLGLHVLVCANKISCQVCGEAFRSRTELRKHQEVHVTKNLKDVLVVLLEAEKEKFDANLASKVIINEIVKKEPPEVIVLSD